MPFPSLVPWISLKFNELHYATSVYHSKPATDPALMIQTQTFLLRLLSCYLDHWRETSP
jgi:hypothetical protein